MKIQHILTIGPVMPVIVLNRVDDAVPLARALVAGGIRVLEITLRTPAGLDSIRAIRDAVPDAVVGAGTIVSEADLAAARDAGAQFGVSPGSRSALMKAAQHSDWPYLPGVMTPSDVMLALQHGITCMKLFPAREAGGMDMLRALYGPFPQVTFCPTGGITAATAADFLKLPNVACVGGSWLSPSTLIDAHDWDAITQLARHATTLAHL